MKLPAIAFAITVSSIVGTALGAQQPTPTPRPPPVRTSLGVDAGYVSFTDSSTLPWTVGALSLGRRSAAGSVIGRVTVARRFGITGAQYEADVYPRLSASTYAYLNAGYSASSIFPEWRFGGELFTNLPRAYEVSLGVRQLQFVGEPVTLFTGSLGKYAGDYWLSVRPYVRSTDQGLSTSTGLTARRYYATTDEYVGARIEFGSAPSDRVTAAELTRTSSVSAGLHGSRLLAPQLIGTWLLRYERETIDPMRSRTRWELNAGARADF